AAVATSPTTSRPGSNGVAGPPCELRPARPPHKPGDVPICTRTSPETCRSVPAQARKRAGPGSFIPRDVRTRLCTDAGMCLSLHPHTRERADLYPRIPGDLSTFIPAYPEMRGPGVVMMMVHRPRVPVRPGTCRCGSPHAPGCADPGATS